MISRVRFVRSVAALCAIIAAAPGALIAQSGRAGVITGRVVVKGSDVPVGYTVVGTNPGNRQEFAGADGHFTLSGVPVGRVAILAKRVGYAQLDTSVDIVAGDTLRITLEIALVTTRLPAVHSLAQVCAHPGGPPALLSAELEVLFEQVRLNADRNRLLSQSFPFELMVERKITKPEPALEARFVAYDTVRVPSSRSWRYEPGKMIGAREYASGAFAGKWLTITIPELSDFADPHFLDNHCFDFGGLDLVDGDSVLRMEFTPAPVVHDPDVAGTLFLDPKTFQLRYAQLVVVNLNKQMRQQIGGQAIRATYSEALPGIPVLDVISSMVYAKDDPKGPPLEPSTETQRTLSVKFLRGKP
jgi:hypothetical protein